MTLNRGDDVVILPSNRRATVLAGAGTTVHVKPWDTEDGLLVEADRLKPLVNLEVQPIFYTLPATELEEGMSTDDGQDVLCVTIEDDGSVSAEVYTPRSDDPELDEENRGTAEWRMYAPGERVHLAVFEDTDVDGSELPEAEYSIF